MKKALINSLENDERMYLSRYIVTIVYDDGSRKEDEIDQYSFADAFEVIKERHEGESNRQAKSIQIEYKQMH